MRTAGAIMRANQAVHEARGKREELELAGRAAMEATIEAIDAGRAAGWTWKRLGRELGVAESALRDYHVRNRRKTHGGNI